MSVALPFVIYVSACLLGQNTRYDGGSKRAEQIFANADARAIYKAICPEVECGLGVPREPMNLYLQDEAPRMIGLQSGRDYSPQMQEYLEAKHQHLKQIPLCGMILKERSPSCGIHGSPLYKAESDIVLAHGSGLFAAYMQRHFPRIPLISEEEYQIPEKRQEFWQRAGEVYESFSKRNL